MPLRALSVWHRLRRLTLACVLNAGLCTAQAVEMADGIAVVTTAQGSIQISAAQGQNFKPDLHQSLVLSGATIESGDAGQLFMALSNGVGIGIHDGSELLVERYQQRPFNAKQQSIRHEPSTSQLTLRLQHGMIALASNQLSPVSRLRIELPHGAVRIHAGTCVLQCNEGEIQITASDSHSRFTYFAPDSSKGEFVVGPERLRVRATDNAIVVKIESITSASLPADCALLAAATRLASQRVFFKASGAAPQPVRIVAQDYWQQAAARPYEFNQ